MDDVTLTGIGMWILTMISAVVVLGAFYIGKFTNGLPIELATFFGIMLAATEVLAVLLVKKFFKIQD